MLKVLGAAHGCLWATCRRLPSRRLGECVADRAARRILLAQAEDTVARSEAVSESIRSCAAAAASRPALVKAYKGRRVVNNVSLDLAQGEIVGLLGPNGAGRRRRST